MFQQCQKGQIKTYQWAAGQSNPTQPGPAMSSVISYYIGGYWSHQGEAPGTYYFPVPRGQGITQLSDSEKGLFF